jgi:hypothetical protein
MDHTASRKRRRARRLLTARDIQALIRVDAGLPLPENETWYLRSRTRELLDLIARCSTEEGREMVLFGFFAALGKPDQQALQEAIRAAYPPPNLRLWEGGSRS